MAAFQRGYERWAGGAPEVSDVYLMRMDPYSGGVGLSGGFLSKLGGALKKVVKVAAPVLAITGVGGGLPKLLGIKGSTIAGKLLSKGLPGVIGGGSKATQTAAAVGSPSGQCWDRASAYEATCDDGKWSADGNTYCCAGSVTPANKDNPGNAFSQLIMEYGQAGLERMRAKLQPAQQQMLQQLQAGGSVTPADLVALVNSLKGGQQADTSTTDAINRANADMQEAQRQLAQERANQAQTLMDVQNTMAAMKSTYGKTLDEQKAQTEAIAAALEAEKGKSKTTMYAALAVAAALGFYFYSSKGKGRR